MSLVSNTSLNENAAQYIGIAARSGLLPYFSSSSDARSSASGCLRNSSQTAGHDAGNAPEEGCASHSAWHVTERSPRKFSVDSALTWREPWIATSMPN
jgi:hypothetical protein